LGAGQVITLLTDFGTQDAYVGVMKGVISSISPQAQIIDLTHAIPPQDLYSARFNLLNAVPYFPEYTIHVVVVDPGVGTSRRGIAVQTDAGILVGPDNGVMSGVWQQFRIQKAVDLTNPQFWRVPTPSTTFHGRDIFAPVAAHIARGAPLEQLGNGVTPESLERIDLPPLSRGEKFVRGGIQYIDHFGNGITTIPADAVKGDPWQVLIGQTELPWCSTYGAVLPGQPLALVGSHGWVEVATNQGNAAQRLHFKIGDPVTCFFSD
jgi:S-adenosylmethionine hydrolase